MRRPTSDIRQRETQHSNVDSTSNRRRNSSLSFNYARLDKTRDSMESDTDFLCDRAVEFMDSGDICSIVTVELAEQSAYFERLLRYHSRRGCIRLPEFLKSGFSSVIDYIRKGCTAINAENVYQIFIAADYLLVLKLKRECELFINDLANDPQTAIHLWITGRHLFWPEIGGMAYKKILENCDRVWPSREFQQLECEDVEEIIRDDSLNCASELEVFAAIVKWTNVSPAVRTKQMLQLLWHIRLGVMSSADIRKIAENSLVSSINEYSQYLKEWPASLSKILAILPEAQRHKFIKSRLPHEALCVFGGWCDGEGPRAAAQVYNPKEDTWTLWTESGCLAQNPSYEWLANPQLAEEVASLCSAGTSTFDTAPCSGSTTPTPEMSQIEARYRHRNCSPPDASETGKLTHLLKLQSQTEHDLSCLLGEIPRRVYAGCVLVGTRVYLVGGFDGSNALKSTLCYDFELDSGWYEISCMYEKRYYVSVAYADNFIYALGGHNGENQGRLDSAERYDLEENLWQPIAAMNRIRSDAAAAELNNRVYVAGGFEGRRYHDSAEFYDPDSNQWTLISRMHSPRGGISLAEHRGCLYAIGGNDGTSRLRNIERLDPETGNWEEVGEMARRKSNLSSAVIGDSIYILGGWSDEPEAGILDMVERFDTSTRLCVEVHPLCFPASATCTCVLRGRNLVRKYIKPAVSLPTKTAGACNESSIIEEAKATNSAEVTTVPSRDMDLNANRTLGTSSNNPAGFSSATSSESVLNNSATTLLYESVMDYSQTTSRTELFGDVDTETEAGLSESFDPDTFFYDNSLGIEDLDESSLSSLVDGNRERPVDARILRRTRQ